MADTTQRQAGRGLPSAYQDFQQVPSRGSRYGEDVSLLAGKGRYVHADEGSYYVATNPTNGTGINGIAGTDAFSDQESLVYLFNGSTVGEGKRIYLDYLKLRLTVAGTNGTTVLWVSKIDNTDRIGSGGSAIVPVNVLMDSSNTFSGKLQFGAVATAAATTGARLVGQGTHRITIGVVGDTYQWNFAEGIPAQPFGAAVGADSTNVVHRVVQHAPIVLGPQQCWVLSVYQTSQTVASAFEFELGFWQR